MDSCGHMDSPQSLNKDQTMDVKRRFFFTRDMEKFERFIIDQMDAI